jgi:tRNA-splicing ligase RtcB
MVRILKTEKLPVKMWLKDVEEGAMMQIRNLANFPFAFSHIVILPDCHQGFGMPIGGVMATEKVIVPNAVGVDIGCGMSAIKTSLTRINPNNLKSIIEEIRKLTPLGFKHQKVAQNIDLMPKLKGMDFKIDELPVISREFNNALFQLGTLGGGNHFIEVQKGSDGHIWIMVHSGSRNIGKQVADHYNNMAKKLNEKWKIKGTYDKQLAFLNLDSREGQMYSCEMQYCINFAYANRKLMMDRIVSVFSNEFKNKINFAPIINIAHNYASNEIHFGKKVVVHRKGATQAKLGQIGIIPGSQGTESYIVRGKGNPDSFESCSHGAGRVLGRKQAQKRLNLKKEVEFLESRNIIHSIRHQKDLDEAPGAYKDINKVMQYQKDLVDIIVKLEPLAVIKG